MYDERFSMKAFEGRLERAIVETKENIRFFAGKVCNVMYKESLLVSVYSME